MVFDAMKNIGLHVNPPSGIYLIRHANTAMNHPDQGERIRGWIDVPLDQSGHAQSEKIAQHAASLKPAHVVSSDLQRARGTADQVGQASGTANQSTHMMRPWNLGQLQGKSAKDAVPVIKEASLPENSDKKIVPGGEEFNAFVKRFTSALTMLLDHFKKTQQTIVVITHYRNLKLAQAWLKGGMRKIDLPVLHSDDTPTGSVMRIFPKGDGWDYEMSKVPGLEQIAKQAAPEQSQQKANGRQDKRALERAKKVDLVTLPDNVSGTSCSNCESIEQSGYCSHPEVMQQIPNPPRMCCAEWNAPGTLRAWEKSGQAARQ